MFISLNGELPNPRFKTADPHEHIGSAASAREAPRHDTDLGTLVQAHQSTAWVALKIEQRD